SAGRFGAGLSGGAGAMQIVDGGVVLVGGSGSLALCAEGGAFGLRIVLAASAGKALGESGASGAGGAQTQLDARKPANRARRVRRGLGDLRDRTKCRLKDLQPALEIAAKMGANELALARQQIAERLVTDAAELTLSDLTEIADLARKAGGDVEKAAMEAIHKR